MKLLLGPRRCRKKYIVCRLTDNTVEQSAWTASATGRHLQTIKMIAENVYV